MISIHPALFRFFALHLLLAGAVSSQGEGDPVQDYAQAVARGEGLFPWQEKGPSKIEEEFRREIEERKTEMLVNRANVAHPVMLGSDEFEIARQNLESNDWAKGWFANQKSVADFILDQPDDFIEKMIPELTPTNPYGFTCPNCVGEKSQEAVGSSLIQWSVRDPDVLSCKACGQTYPDPKYPETAVLHCPRMDQEFTFYLNENERRHPQDRSGKHAYHWVGRPIHVSFTGIIRLRKIEYMISSVLPLAYAYTLTEDVRYAEKCRDILLTLAERYPRWLYHDYWDSFADCDPMVAAWHDKNLKLGWKRHLCVDAYRGDSPERAAMLQTFWGAGRIHPSTDGVSWLKEICLAYDLVLGAANGEGAPIWTPVMRQKVERDLLLEWVMSGEPFVGGKGMASEHNNKTPRVYLAQAAVGRCLGIPELADVAVRGYEAVRDHSFLYDGFSTESPAYTNMYLSTLIEIPETLKGFKWPDYWNGREGTYEPYESDSRLRLMFRGVVEQLRPDGRYLPLSDTNVETAPGRGIFEIGLKRYPDLFAGKMPSLYRGQKPGEYAVFHLEQADLEREEGLNLPEIYFPAWMTAILRQGSGPDSTVVALPFNPPGGHRHFDNLSLFYSDRGRTILGDHGYVGDMPMNRWIRDTASHNLVIVDDQGQFHRNPGPRAPALRFLATTPRISLIEAESKAYEQCDEHRRLIGLIKGPENQSFVLDIFRVKGGAKHDYRLFSEIGASDREAGGLSFVGIEIPPQGPLPAFGSSLKDEHIYGLRDIRSADQPVRDWQAVWSEKGDFYRFWNLTEASRVEASHGPGQQTRSDAGRRVRYLDVVREGDLPLESQFVAIHEPCGPESEMPIQRVERLAPPQHAGPQAIALRVETDWGEYLILNEFETEAEVAGVRFQGDFGVLFSSNDRETWLLALGAPTLGAPDFGFEGRTAGWKSRARKVDDFQILAESSAPPDWESPPPGFQNYVLFHDGEYNTGLPMVNFQRDQIQVERFPIRELETIKILNLVYQEKN